MTPAGSVTQDASTQTAPPRNLWLWVPSLYFSQGIPYVIVMTMSVIMYRRLGVSNTDIALYTSWLYLPWVLKPLWSPLVDITRTKRAWIVSMQFLVSLGLALAAVAVRGGAFFKWSLLLFWIMAFASATHDIAADGFYMLSLTRHDQAWWVGLRSTFYRTAMIVGSGLLVVLAGVMENRHGLAAVAIPLQAVAADTVSAASTPPPTSAGDAMRIVFQPPVLRIPMAPRSGTEIEQVLQQARAWNRSHGFEPEDTPPAQTSSSTGPFGRVWNDLVADPLRRFLLAHFPKQTQSPAPATTGNLGLLSVALSQSPAPGQTLIVSLDPQRSGLEYLGLAHGDKGFRLIEGQRLAFTPDNWIEPARAVIQLDPKLKQPAAVTFLATSGNIPLAWSITLFAVAALFLAFSCWHALVLPRPATDGPVRTHAHFLSEFLATLGSFFRKPGILMALAFILLYRFDEAQLSKVISPFLLDPRPGGGLGLTTSQVGLAYGTFGILALTGGGLLGGFLAARYGLKRMLPVMVCSMYLPKLAWIFLSFLQPENFLAVCGALALEQFGYGFGFTAFMLYLLYFADGPHKTAHYAICTGFMALGMMLPGMWSGWLVDLVGYKHFFVWVSCSAVPGFILAMLLKIDPQFGRKTA